MRQTAPEIKGQRKNSAVPRPKNNTENGFQSPSPGSFGAAAFELPLQHSSLSLPLSLLLILSLLLFLSDILPLSPTHSWFLFLSLSLFFHLPWLLILSLPLSLSLSYSNISPHLPLISFAADSHYHSPVLFQRQPRSGREKNLDFPSGQLVSR